MFVADHIMFFNYIMLYMCNAIYISGIETRKDDDFNPNRQLVTFETTTGAKVASICCMYVF